MHQSDFIWAEAVDAIGAATSAAIFKARQTITNFDVVIDGKIVEVRFDEAEKC